MKYLYRKSGMRIMKIKVKQGYSIGELFIVLVSLLYTKLFWRKGRLLRIPCRMRGENSIEIGMKRSNAGSGWNNRNEVSE